MTTLEQAVHSQVDTIINACWPDAWTNDPAPPEVVPTPPVCQYCSGPLPPIWIAAISKLYILEEGMPFMCECRRKGVLHKSRDRWFLKSERSAQHEHGRVDQPGD